MPDLSLEMRYAGARVCGIDEAGRGPLAGPVVAAAVVFRKPRLPRRFLSRLDDSKLLTPAVRAELLPEIYEHGEVGIGSATVEEIDRVNILQATFLAMQRAMTALGEAPTVALVDGNQPPELGCTVETVIGGDGLCASIAAASIVAKVTRDTLMIELSEHHPGYGWERNVGYGTPEHLDALTRLGITAQHRRSFRPVYEVLTVSA
jgi:ribonuclease HII